MILVSLDLRDKVVYGVVCSTVESGREGSSFHGAFPPLMEATLQL